MRKLHYYTDEERTEILSNPYTARLTEYTVYFTLEFKRFVMNNVDKPGMTVKKLFRLAGYDDKLFSSTVRFRTVQKIRAEAESPQGLQEPKMPKEPPVKKKQTATEIKDLQNRVKILEQQIEFLKKSQHLKNQDRMNHQNNTS